MSTPSNNENKDNENKDKKNIKKKVNIKQKKIQETTTIDVNDVNDVNVNNDVNDNNDVNNDNVIVNIITLATDKKDKTDKEKIPKKTIVRGGKKIKKADDTNYLRLPEDIKTGVIDYSDSITVNKQLNNNIIILQNKIKAMHQILWENEHMDGEEALNEIMTFIFLKYLGKFISDKDEPNKVDILNPKYTKQLTDTYDNEEQHNLYNKAVNYIKDFKSILKDLDDGAKTGAILGSKGCSKGNKEDLQYNENALTKEIINNVIEQDDCFKIITKLLALHPTTKVLCAGKANLLTINNFNTFAHLIKHINSPCFDDSNEIEDLIGEIYEYFLNKYNKKKSALGQFFTPRMLMSITIKFKFNRINEIIKDIANPIFADKCMGTGGWLVKLYNMFKSANNTNNDTNDDTNTNNTNTNNTNDDNVPETNKNKYKLHTDILLHGREFKSNTYQYGIINLISTIGCYPHKPASGCSLTNIEDKSVLQLNVVISNPPFKGKYEYVRLKTDYNNNKYIKDKHNKDIKREGFNTASFEDIYFLEDEDNTPLQFLQLYIHTLADNGICMIVLPYGELFFKDGKSNIIRKNLLDKIDITDIILCPCGIFTHTNVKVCMLIFEKNKTGTKAIKFSKFNFDKTEQILQSVTHITTVSKKDILLEPICSFYHMDYLHDPYVNKMQLLTDKFEWIPFGDIFELIKGEIPSGKVEEIEDGVYPFITTSIEKDWKYINSYTNIGPTVFIAELDGGNNIPIRYTDKNNSHSDLMLKLSIKHNTNYTNKINTKYIYHYLLTIQKHITCEYERGSSFPRLDVKNFNRMKIPIPPMEIQLHIIKQMDGANGKITGLQNIVDIMKFTDIPLRFQIGLDFSLNMAEWIPFGDIFELIKGEIPSGKVEEIEDGVYPFITTSIEKDWKYINSYTNIGPTVFIAELDGGNNIPIRYTDKNNSHSDLMLKLSIKHNTNYTNKINTKYIYHYLLTIQKHITCEYERGSSFPRLDVKNFNRMKIPILPLERQNYIINTINNLEIVINRWEHDIAELKKEDILNFTAYLVSAHNKLYTKEPN